MTLRDAATICLVRAAHHGPEVLMVRRPDTAKFMGSAWVFPGGAVDEFDTGPEAQAAVQTNDEEFAAWRAAGLRELVEETGIWLTVDGAQVTDKRPNGVRVFDAAPATLDGDALHYFANWITPAPLPIRFDTRFFVAEVPRRIEALVDGKELVDTTWIDPVGALDRAAAGDWLVAFPTRNTLQDMSGHDSVASLIEAVTGSSEVKPVQPRLVVGKDAVAILLPTDPGFDEAGADEEDPELLARAMAVADAGGEIPAELHRA
jgi:8-oxo-dGTP pyrophosphatase MutT (NUDIX family)